MAKNGELTSNQKRMIAAMLTSKTIGAACDSVGVGRTTLTRWLGQDEFINALRQAQSEAITRAGSQLIAAQEEAITTLRALAERARNEGVRRAAANDLLSYSLKFDERLEIAERIAALEKAVFDGDK